MRRSHPRHREEPWKPWFAWHAVTFFEADSMHTVWLEWIERRAYYEYHRGPYYDYRLPRLTS